MKISNSLWGKKKEKQYGRDFTTKELELKVNLRNMLSPAVYWEMLVNQNEVPFHLNHTSKDLKFED